ncbi:ribosomal maturation YjgA family protein [Flavobacterium sp.]
MKRANLFYFIVTLFVILLGILSRAIHAIPLFMGDILYAVMVYFGFRMVLVKISDEKKILFPLLFCYLIEIQQLFKAAWVVKIRSTSLGHYALGQGFLWSDIIWYTVGVAVAYTVDIKFIKSKI